MSTHVDAEERANRLWVLADQYARGWRPMDSRICVREEQLVAHAGDTFELIVPPQTPVERLAGALRRYLVSPTSVTAADQQVLEGYNLKMVRDKLPIYQAHHTALEGIYDQMRTLQETNGIKRFIRDQLDEYGRLIKTVVREVGALGAHSSRSDFLHARSLHEAVFDLATWSTRNKHASSLLSTIEGRRDRVVVFYTILKDIGTRLGRRQVRLGGAAAAVAIISGLFLTSYFTGVPTESSVG